MRNRFFVAWCIWGFLTVTSLPLFAQDSAQKVTPPKPKPVAVKPVATQQLPVTQTPAGTKPVQTTAPGVQPEKPVATVSDSAGLASKKLVDQYQYVLSKIYRYQQPLIGNFWKNVVDTLNAERKLLKSSQAKIDEMTKNVNNLQTAAASKQQTIETTSQNADSISILGVSISKTVFTITMLTIIGALVLALIIIIATTGKHKREARYRSGLYEELEEEYRNYKAKANEKEKKLARELQTERNKLDELLGRG